MASEYKLKYKRGEYNSCYEPYPPFYNMCVTGTKNITKMVKTDHQASQRRQCVRCIIQNKFFGYEELARIEEEPRSATSRLLHSLNNNYSDDASLSAYDGVCFDHNAEEGDNNG